MSLFDPRDESMSDVVTPVVHAIVSHMGTHQKRSLRKLAAGRKVNQQTIGSFWSRGLVREDEHGALIFTDAGTAALRIITEENHP